MPKTFKDVEKYIINKISSSSFQDFELSPENMELYKLHLPIHLIKTIISFNYQEISEVEIMMWKTRLGLMRNLITTNSLKGRGVEEDMICFGVGYDIPSFEYL